MTCQIPGTADSTALSSFYSWKEKSTNLERPTGITYNQKIRRFRGKKIFGRKVSSITSGQFGACRGIGLPAFTLAMFAAIFAAILVVISWQFQIARVNYWQFRGDLKKRWRKGENITSNSIHKTQQSVGINQNATQVNHPYFLLRKPSGKLWCSPNPPSLRKFSTIRPPSPSEFPSPSMGRYGYFLELHIVANK